MQLPRPQQFTAKLEEKTQHNERYVQYSFELTEPHQMPFIAGQYVSIKVSERGERRSYSICSSPSIEHGFELLLDISPQGLGCKYLESLKYGDTMSFLGPLGTFTVSEQEESARYFIATGSGIAPFRSMILDELQNKHDERPLVLYWGQRHEQDMFWELEFQELAQNFSQFSNKIILSQPGDQWPLDKGRVTDLLTVLEKPVTAGYYLCGNGAMVKQSIEILEQSGVPQTHIHHEMFY